MNEEPNEPSGQAPDVQAEDVGHGGSAADDGHVAFVEIMKRRQIFLALQPGANSFCGVGAALNGKLRDTGKELRIFSVGGGEIADYKNFRIVGNGQVRANFDATTAIGFCLGALGEFSAERCGHDTARPDDSFRGELFGGVAASV